MFPCQWSHASLAAIAVVSRPYDVIATPLLCIDLQPPITAWEYIGLITSPHMVTSINRSRHALFPLHKNFGLFRALTNLYRPRHALIITKHLSCNELSPGCCPQPPTGHRPQVAAGLHANSNLRSLDRCRTSTRFHSRCVYWHKLSNKLLPGNHTLSCRPSTEIDRRCVHGHMLLNEMSPGSHTPSLRRYCKAIKKSTDTTIRSFATKLHGFVSSILDRMVSLWIP